MPQGCIIPDCFGDKKRSVYKVPKNVGRREKWVKAIRDVYSIEVGENFRVCEKHFRKADFTTYLNEEYGEVIHEVEVKRKRLKQGAVPDFTDVLNLSASNVPMKTILMDQDEPEESISDPETAGSCRQAHPSTPEPQDTDNTSRQRNKKKIPYPCNVCKLPFGSKRLLFRHKCCVCKICSKPWGNANHKNCPKVFSCACGEKFPSKRKFAAHQKIHVRIYGHCPTCCKQFTNETDLINHVNKMKFPCIYCSTCFPNIEELSAHSIANPEAPNYSCKSCKEIFADSFTATSHSRSHGAPLRSYSRKPKPVNAQEKHVPSTKALVNNVVGEEHLNEPCELYNEPEPEGSVNKLDGINDKGRLFDKKKEKPYDRTFDGDSEKRMAVTELKLECVKVEFEIDEEMREPNQNELDTGISSKPTPKVVKVEAHFRENKGKTIEKEFEVVVTEKTTKVLESVKVEPTDEEIRENIKQVDVVTRKPSKLLVKIEPEFRDEHIKKEPDERELELLFEADQDRNEEHNVKIEPVDT